MPSSFDCSVSWTCSFSARRLCQQTSTHDFLFCFSRSTVLCIVLDMLSRVFIACQPVVTAQAQERACLLVVAWILYYWYSGVTRGPIRFDGIRDLGDANVTSARLRTYGDKWINRLVYGLDLDFDHLTSTTPCKGFPILSITKKFL